VTKGAHLSERHERTPEPSASLAALSV
jgi:hypothetical protein